MTASATVDRSEFRQILWFGTRVGVLIAATVIVCLIVARLIPPGIARALLQTVVVIAGGVIASFLPAYWATSRTTQGIASAAGIGLWGTIVFMAIDIILLRPFHAYPWTWDAVGGGSSWWYLPIWWMLGTFLAWMGGLVTAGRAARGGDVSIRSLAIAPAVGALGVAIGLGLGGIVYMPVAAGAGFTLTLTVFALIATLRRS
jgi:hypothetical protein